MSSQSHYSDEPRTQWFPEPPGTPRTPRTPAYTSSTGLTPYLTLPHHLSLTWLATPILSLLFIVFRLWMSMDDARNASDDAKSVLLASCASAQKAASAAVNLPRFLAEGVNSGVESAVNDTIDAAKDTMIFALTALEGIIEFVIDLYRSTLLCFLELAVRGTLDVLIAATQAFSDFITSTLNTVRTNIQNDIGTANSAIQSAVSGINNLIPSVLNIHLTVPQFSIPSLDGLQNVQLPTTIQDGLTQLNQTIPSLDDIRQALDNLIEEPFNALKTEINGSFSGFRFDKAVLPLPDEQQLTFCDGMDTSVVDDLVRDVLKIAKIGVFLLLALALLMILGNCLVQWYRWKSLHRTLDRIREVDGNLKPNAALPSLEMSDRNLLSLSSTLENPLAATVAQKLAKLLRLGPQKTVNLRFMLHYIFSPPALACFLIGVFGILSVQLQLLAIAPVQRHYSSVVATQVNGFASQIADQVNGNMQTQSALYASQVNAHIDSLQTNVNNGVFGWVNGTVVPLNNTIEAFYTDIQNVVQTVFGNTVLATPMQELVRCLIGSKVDALENALTFVQANFQVRIRQVDPNVLVLSNSTVQEATSPIAAAAVGSGSGDQNESLVGKLVNRYVASLQKELMMFEIFLTLWLVVVVMAIGIVAWHSYGRSGIFAWRKRRHNRRVRDTLPTPWLQEDMKEKKVVSPKIQKVEISLPKPLTMYANLPNKRPVINLDSPITTYSNLPPKRPVINLDSPSPPPGLPLPLPGRKTPSPDPRQTRKPTTDARRSDEDVSTPTSDGGFLVKLGGIFGRSPDEENGGPLLPPLPRVESMQSFGRPDSSLPPRQSQQPQPVQLTRPLEPKKSMGAESMLSESRKSIGANVVPHHSRRRVDVPQSISGMSFADSRMSRAVPLHHSFLPNQDARFAWQPLPVMPTPLAPTSQQQPPLVVHRRTMSDSRQLYPYPPTRKSSLVDPALMDNNLAGVGAGQRKMDTIPGTPVNPFSTPFDDDNRLSKPSNPFLSPVARAF